MHTRATTPYSTLRMYTYTLFKDVNRLKSHVIRDQGTPIGCGYSGGENLSLHMHSIAFPAFTSLSIHIYYATNVHTEKNSSAY